LYGFADRFGLIYIVIHDLEFISHKLHSPDFIQNGELQILLI
jgi:hypothetical protein